MEAIGALLRFPVLPDSRAALESALVSKINSARAGSKRSEFRSARGGAAALQLTARIVSALVRGEGEGSVSSSRPVLDHSSMRDVLEQRLESLSSSRDQLIDTITLSAEARIWQDALGGVAHSPVPTCDGSGLSRRGSSLSMSLRSSSSVYVRGLAERPEGKTLLTALIGLLCALLLSPVSQLPVPLPAQGYCENEDGAIIDEDRCERTSIMAVAFVLVGAYLLTVKLRTIDMSVRKPKKMRLHRDNSEVAASSADSGRANTRFATRSERAE